MRRYGVVLVEPKIIGLIVETQKQKNEITVDRVSNINIFLCYIPNNVAMDKEIIKFYDVGMNN
jgi:hypothetical protein